jgi:hypothetical protein
LYLKNNYLATSKLQTFFAAKLAANFATNFAAKIHKFFGLTP